MVAPPVVKPGSHLVVFQGGIIDSGAFDGEWLRIATGVKAGDPSGVDSHSLVPLLLINAIAPMVRNDDASNR